MIAEQTSYVYLLVFYAFVPVNLLVKIGLYVVVSHGSRY